MKCFTFCFGIRQRFFGKTYRLRNCLFTFACSMALLHKKVGDSYAWLTPLIFFSTPTFFSLPLPLLSNYKQLLIYFWVSTAGKTDANENNSWFILMTLFAGAAVTTKLTSIIILPLALIGLTIHGRSHKNVNQTAIQCLNPDWVPTNNFSLARRNYFFTAILWHPFS
ncbi:MAG: hypothetical protein CM1200mP16_13320 [Nitrospina sp.]|nr:MAG: hypothetical protein CM1200mP16_13320 [Nitrospina sp.]